MTYLALLRAINVGGHASVRMTDLKDAFARAGCLEVKTYIQSGNVVFQAPEKQAPALFRKIRLELRSLLGQEPGIQFRTVGEVERLVKRAPFKGFERARNVKQALGVSATSRNWSTLTRIVELVKSVPR